MTLPLDVAGRPGAPVVTPSTGAVPFGFAFGDVVVSEAGASTVSSYRLGNGSLDAVNHVALTARPRLLAQRAHLYAASPTGRVTGSRVGSDGSLEHVTSVPAAAGITGAAAG